MKVKIHAQTPPAELLEALSKAVLRYTTPDTIFRLEELWPKQFVGVFGDGENGSYEWFVWLDGQLTTSNCSFGMIEAALRDVLVREVV